MLFMVYTMDEILSTKVDTTFIKKNVSSPNMEKNIAYKIIHNCYQ